MVFRTRSGTKIGYLLDLVDVEGRVLGAKISVLKVASYLSLGEGKERKKTILQRLFYREGAYHSP